MSRILCGTDYVLEDEACLGLYELIFPILGEQHRQQIIIVNRNDKPTEYRIDMGLASQFGDLDQFRIPGGVIEPDGKIYSVHTVGQLRDIAYQLHKSNLVDKTDRFMSKPKSKLHRTKKTGTN